MRGHLLALVIALTWASAQAAEVGGQAGGLSMSSINSKYPALDGAPGRLSPSPFDPGPRVTIAFKKPNIVQQPVNMGEAVNILGDKKIIVPPPVNDPCRGTAVKVASAWQANPKTPETPKDFQSFYNAHKSDIDAYKTACFLAAGQPPPSYAAASPAVGALVVTYDGTEQAICTAFIIAPNVAMTARHCFYTISSNKPQFPVLSMVAFRPFSNLNASYTVKKLVGAKTDVGRGDKGPILFADDYVFVEIDPYAASPIPSGKPQGTPATMPGVLAYTAAVNWKDAASWGNDQNCKLLPQVNTSGTCMTHTCQGTPGFSGSPILEVTPAGPTVVAMQIAQSDHTDCTTPDDGTLNVAMPVAPLIAAFNAGG